VPTPPVPGLTFVAPAALPTRMSLFPLPSSPAFTPTPPPPIGLG
jgi:hypothetical protein